MQQAPVNSVELWAGDIPGPVGRFAVHYWLVIHRDDCIERWEVWQLPALSQPSWGHLHLNLMPHDQWLANARHWREQCWHGPEVTDIAREVSRSPQHYAHCHRYHYWPGPNSNTYIQTILDHAGVEFALAPRGIGKDYLGWWGHRRSGRQQLFSTPLIGVRLGWPEHVELHLLSLCFGMRRNGRDCPWQFVGPLSRQPPN